jgi:hypothetical protein
MSQLAPAKIRLWIEMWKEEVMSSLANETLQQKFEESQVEKGRSPQKTPNKMQTETEGGGHLL